MQEYSLYIIFFIFSCLALLIVLKPLGKFKKSTVLTVAGIIVLVGCSYLMWGGWFALERYKTELASQQHVQDVLKNIKSPDELIDKLAAHLKQNPDSDRGWYLLGRIYSSQQKLQHALNAFAKAYKLNPDDKLIVINYAQTLLENDDEKGRELLINLLKKDPKQPDALSLLAMDSYNRQEYQEAINYWQRLLILVPADSKESEMIRKAIAKAHSNQ
jgi:cytochrome c-type biogenesis protein CcmH